MDDAHFESLIADLVAARVRVDATVRAVPGGRWEDVIHTGDGAWTRKQQLAHMASNDLRQLVRIRIGAGIPEPGDERDHAADLQGDTWNRQRVDEREGQNVERLLSEMRANREALLGLLGRLTPEQRQRPMPFRGQPTPLADMIPLLIGHLDQHAAELVAGFG